MCQQKCSQRGARKCEKMKKRIGGKIIIAMLLAVTVFFAGCTQEKLIEFALEETLHLAVDAVAAENEDVAKVVTHIEKRVDIEVLSSQITADGVVAQCRVSSPDLTDFVENFDMNEYATQEEVIDAICKAVDTTSITTHEMNLGFLIQDGSYELVEVDAFLNAYCGGCLELLQDMQK